MSFKKIYICTYIETDLDLKLHGSVQRYKESIKRKEKSFIKLMIFLPFVVYLASFSLSTHYFFCCYFYFTKSSSFEFFHTFFLFPNIIECWYWKMYMYRIIITITIIVVDLEWENENPDNKVEIYGMEELLFGNVLKME